MSYGKDITMRFWKQKIGKIGSIIVLFFVFIALYAPLLASSKPLVVVFEGHFYFPLLRYYLSSFFFSKGIDLFFNVLGVVAPLFLLLFWIPQKWRFLWSGFVSFLGVALFLLFYFFIALDPANSRILTIERHEAMQRTLNLQTNTTERERYPFPNFDFELEFMNDYAKLNLVLDADLKKMQDKRIHRFTRDTTALTLYSQQEIRDEEQLERLQQKIDSLQASYAVNLQKERELRLHNPDDPELLKLTKENQQFEETENRLHYLQDKRTFIEKGINSISFLVMPVVRPLHWQDDAGGNQALNLQLPVLELSRLNRQDLMSGLLFGARISLFVGLFATILSLAIGVPLGLISGYFGGRSDLVLCRFVEVWESMPAFFMLLLIVTLLQSKSIFLIISVIAIFAWPSSFRFVRAETFRQRELLYIDAARSIGFGNIHILFSDLLPNCIVPVVALLPFDMMASITREAGLSFLGLGEEQTCSWGALMDEGRAAFPAESALLWPPAIALTLLLLAIALVGEALHNAMDPKTAV